MSPNCQHCCVQLVLFLKNILMGSPAVWEGGSSKQSFKQRDAFMRLGAVRQCIHLAAWISLCACQNVLPPPSFPTTPVLVSAPHKHAAVAVPLTATSSLLRKNISRCWKGGWDTLSQSSKNTLFTFRGGLSVREQQLCCTNIPFVRTVGRPSREEVL